MQRIKIHWICKIMASWIRIRILKNIQIEGSESKEEKNNQKLQKKHSVKKIQ